MGPGETSGAVVSCIMHGMAALIFVATLTVPLACVTGVSVWWAFNLDRFRYRKRYRR